MNAPLDSLGPVSRHVAEQARQAVNRHGVVVWLDLDGHYTGLARALRDAHARGAFPVPVVCFEGSFLELLLALREHGQGRSRRPVLVHMPGFNEARIHQTPALETYRAGTRYRVALDTMVRDAAVGRVTPAVLEDFLAGDGLTLEAADAWLIRAAAVASGELGAWLEPHAPTTVLAALLAKSGGPAALSAEDAGGVLEAWFERKLGVDAAWRRFSNRIRGRDAGRRAPDDVHLAPLTHALCVEYVSDLRRAPLVDALVPLTRLPAALRDANLELCRWFRRDHPDRYQSLANEVESLLKVEEREGRPEDLGEVDTFRFEEARLMRAALDALDEDAWEQALTWSEGRSDQQSFWARRQPSRRAAWRLIARMARLGQALQASWAELEDAPWHSHDGAVASYTAETAGGWRVDTAHRALETEIATHWDARLPHYAVLQDRVRKLRQAYRHWADTLARRYADLCATHGPLPDPRMRLRGVFRRSVRALLDAHRQSRVAYLLLDGFRYELGAHLAALLQADRGVDVTLEARIAPGPTDTWLCMNTLALDQDGTDPLDVHAWGVGVRAGAFAIDTPDKRRRAMREASGLPSVTGLSLGDTLDLDADTLAHKVRSSRLVVVQSPQPDKAGEAGNGLRMFERILSLVRSAIERLREAGVQYFVLTTDHGFLLHDPDHLERIPFGKRSDPARRVARHPDVAPEPHLLVVSPRHLELTGVDGSLVFPRSTGVFDQGRAHKGYVHGGMSLQERVVPLLTVRHRNPRGQSTLTYRLEVRALSAGGASAGLEVTLRVASTGMLAFGGEDSVDLGFRVPDRPDVDVDLVRVDDAEAVGALVRARVDQPFRVFLRLTAPREEKVRIEFYDPAGSERVRPALADGWFAALARAVQDPAPQAPAPSPPAPRPDTWLDDYEDAGVRAIFAHLAAHGAITETECTRLLGSPRKFRRFSRQIETLVLSAPFDVRVEGAASGKRYVREGAT